jgi:hypothetical protein
MTFHTTNSSIAGRWIAGFVMVAGLGAAIVTGGAVASADTTTTVGPTAEGANHGTSDVDYQSARRRATFSGASVSEVKLDDLDANNNKK